MEKYFDQLVLNVQDNVKIGCVELINVGGTYSIWIFTHYISSQLYVKWCVNWSVMGFIFSPFLVNTPHCKALLWGINNSVINIQNMWLLIGYWFMNRINPLHENVKKD
jgi:hypothetical protein|tara:strand:- start:64 stop:387 length:324 start_codon:yes stop_codon:yes gene_type:complete